MYDFSGYATKNDLKCSDGRIIRQDAFKDQDGAKVPLVWQHMHNSVENVLGNAVLENRSDGVYAYCSLNNTEQGKYAKELIKHGDIESMSIWANQLIEKGKEVLHGSIKEVSLVLAGANPGARIENVSFSHADGVIVESDGDVVITMNQPFTVYDIKHADDKEDEEDKENKEDNEEETKKVNNTSEKKENKEETVGEVFGAMDRDKQSLIVYVALRYAGLSDEDIEKMSKESESDSKETVQHADTSENKYANKDVKDIFDSFTEEEKAVAYYMIDILSKNIKKELEKAGQKENNTSEESDEEESEETTVKHNVFDSIDETSNEHILSHDEMTSIMTDARSNRASLKDTFLQHGIENIDVLFPEARNVTPTPEIISRQMEWVSKVWNGVKKSPFSRIKSVAANLTFDDARAKGYLKYPDDHDQDGSEYPGDGIVRKKLMEKFPLLSRVTIPQTIYKLQKLHRDDIIDITDLDVVSWLKTEMRTMLDEELSRAILIGDGRDASAEDKIRTENIRPIYGDDDVYTIYYTVDFSEATDATEISNTLIDAANYARKDYMGSGNPVFFASPVVVTYLLLAKDKLGRRLYPTLAELASALRVSAVVEVPAFEDQTRTDSDDNEMDLLGLIVDLSDYTVGADKMGSVNMFDDFDIDYNMYTYMIETRCSGALTKPYSAIALEASATSSTSLSL